MLTLLAQADADKAVAEAAATASTQAATTNISASISVQHHTDARDDGSLLAEQLRTQLQVGYVVK